MDKTLLVVEWDDDYRCLLVNGLGADGYRVVEARDSREALDRFRRRRPDAVVLALKSPDMDGIDVMYRIMAIRKDIPIIINSAYTRFRDNYLCWAADDFVRKSSDLGDLRKSLAVILSAGSPRDRMTHFSTL